MTHRERRAALEAIATRHGHAVYYIVASELAIALDSITHSGAAFIETKRTWDSDAIAQKAEACAAAIAALDANVGVAWKIVRDGAIVRVSVTRST